MSVLLSVIYLIATVMFVVGLNKLAHPETAKKGNLISAIGMVLAIAGTIFVHDIQVPTIIYLLIGGAIVIGGIIGWLIAIKVEMTKMPELVSLFNGFGGASATLIGLVEFSNNTTSTLQATTITSGVIIGAITFSGSLIAFGKLNGSLKSVVKLPQYNFINNLVLIAIVALAAYMIVIGGNPFLIYALLVVDWFTEFFLYYQLAAPICR